ncbi:hypothetical protein P7H06_15595 [Paenibacillus larvae]|nr:hypothetical protein [Paenibacillus larvae]MDT2260645.1 hypothetical protein [Paenibacillus larvae]
MRREIKRVIQDHHGYTESEYDKYGRPVISYGGIPIGFIETDAQNEIIGFDETNNATSLYAVRFGPEQYVRTAKQYDQHVSSSSVNLMRNPATGLVSNGILRWLYSTHAPLPVVWRNQKRWRFRAPKPAAKTSK